MLEKTLFVISSLLLTSENDFYMSDLYSRNRGNSLVKFEDDTYLIIRPAVRHTVQDEHLGVQQSI